MPAPSGAAVYPRWTEDQLTVPRLSHNGEIIEGWCRPPASGVWSPSELLWSPDTATKASDFDPIARIVDVSDSLGDLAWVQAQTDKRAKYLERIRELVRAGKYRLTAGMAKLLGWDEDEAELVPRTGTGTLVYSKAATVEMIEEGRRMAGLAAAGASDDRVKTIAAQAAKRYAETGDMAAAMDAIARAVRGARIDPDTGLPEIGGRA